MRKKQLEFKGFKRPKDAFGGSLLKGNPKTKRPLSSKLPIHVVLRANRGGMRAPVMFGKVNSKVYETAKKYGVRVYEFANVGNHLHMVARVTNIRLWAAFIRELASGIVQALGLTGYWKHRPFTRIIRGWRRAFQDAKEYVHLNVLEAEGFISRKDTKTLKDLRAIFVDT